MLKTGIYPISEFGGEWRPSDFESLHLSLPLLLNVKPKKSKTTLDHSFSNTRRQRISWPSNYL